MKLPFIRRAPAPGAGAALDLRDYRVHNGAAISGEDPLEITTAAGQWSYAAAFRYRGMEKGSAGRILLRVKARVEEGRIGVAFVKDDLKEILGNDEERSPVDGETTVEIVVDGAPDSGWIVIRNNAPGGVPSRCAIYALEASTLPPAARHNIAELARADDFGGSLFAALREKWSEVPAGLTGRRKTADLLKLEDEKLAALWNEAHRESTAGQGYAARGWYHELYADVLRGRKVLDVGSGFGVDGISFARAGAHMTFLDIAPSNLDVLRRLCRIFQIENPDFLYLEDLNSLDRLPADFDVIWCQGSMIHSPFEFAQREVRKLLEHLRAGGRWIELAYPRERWEREGRLGFDQWGKRTDGAATPWAEWYDLTRLRERLRPAKFDPVLSFNFHGDDFIWFDLVRRA